MICFIKRNYAGGYIVLWNLHWIHLYILLCDFLCAECRWESERDVFIVRCQDNGLSSHIVSGCTLLPSPVTGLLLATLPQPGPWPPQSNLTWKVITVTCLHFVCCHGFHFTELTSEYLWLDVGQHYKRRGSVLHCIPSIYRHKRQQHYPETEAKSSSCRQRPWVFPVIDRIIMDRRDLHLQSAGLFPVWESGQIMAMCSSDNRVNE